MRRLSVLAAAFFVFAAFTSLLTMGATGQILAPSDPVITSGPDDPTNSQDATFTFTGDPGVTFMCKLDDGSFDVCESPGSATYSGLVQGFHLFSVKAVDELDNESGIISYDWTIDLTGPTTSITATPNDPSNDSSPSFSFTSPDGSATFECKLDDGSFASCSSPETYPGLSERSYTFEVRARDEAGNADATPASYTWTIDTTPPSTTITAKPTSPSDDSSPTFSFTSSEAGSSFQCALDGGALSNCSSPKTYFGVVEGSHTFVVSATDPAGNNDSIGNDSYAWAIDTSAPVVTVSSPADGGATSETTPAISGVADTGPADSSLVAVALYRGTSTSEPPLQEWSNVPVDQGTGSWSVVSPSLTEDSYIVQASQNDSLGRSGSDTHTFRVDLQVPAMALTSPSNGLVTKNSTLTFAGSAGTDDGDHPQVTIVISQDTTPVETVLDVPVTSGSWSWTPTAPLADGTYTVHAEQSDDTGGTGTSNVNSFTVDTTLPSALSTANIVSGYGYVMLRWTRGLDWQPDDQLVIRRRVGTSSSVRRYRGTGTSFKDGRVANGVTYVYDLFAVDRAGNRSPALSRTARPSGFRAPRHGSLVWNPPEIRWVDVANSTYSNIQVWNARVTVKMLSVWPKGTRYALRSRWTFAGHVYRLRPGHKYKIYGWPGFGPKSASRYGKSYGWVSFIYR